MASKYNIQVLLFLLSLSTLSLKASSLLKSGKEEDYNSWISWNVNNFRKKYNAEVETLTREPTGIESKVLDLKLRNAEMNKVRINVGQDGTGDFKSIKEALASIPLHNTKRVILAIKPGVYREKIVIPRTLPFITFLGDSNDPPTITGNDTKSVTGTTFSTATVGVNASYFVAINMKFENTAPHDEGSVGEQAVALRISGTNASFYNCSFYGSQDTLYDHHGVHYFRNCFIQGSVDFIFGYARSLYENCTLNSIAKKAGGSFTAQKRTNSSWDSGFSFQDCKVTGSGLAYLGRAWGDRSRVIFSYTYMDNVVRPEGWHDWGYPERNLTVYYGEYKCSGPGANFTGRVPWARLLTDKEAEPFIGTHYIYGDTWLIHPAI
ncbi:hypothetical protein RHMOL_Rhmol13G0004500 [Rhododendron molle]|uniref:Uncharacterized protein n=1 Tax=Rhododendron molle TaxID=49168 RepID=A0ACC0L2E3_RHOML|nr:hypothetical protein RHMOL_Rhmol13G0004500 [Rhododendron molle]